MRNSSNTWSVPATPEREAEFLLNPNRFNVSITRPRAKLVVLLGDAVLRTLPRDERVMAESMALKGYPAHCDGGTRAVEQWRMILAATVMFTIRRQVSLLNFGDWDGDVFTPIERRAGELTRMLDQLEKATAAMLTMRG